MSVRARRGQRPARVRASRLLGRSSMLHLDLPATGAESASPDVQADDGIRLHARIPGRFLPAADDLLDVQLDRSQTFVFPADHVT